MNEGKTKKEIFVSIAERNLKKAQHALKNNFVRAGITEEEKENLSNNVEYAQTVYNLILSKM